MKRPSAPLLRWLFCCATAFFVPSPALVAQELQPGSDVVVADFESATYGDWETEGNAFGSRPTQGASLRLLGYRGDQFANSFGGSDDAVGTLASPRFSISRPYLALLIGGGQREGELGAELIINGQSVRSATGNNSDRLRWQSWDVSQWQGAEAQMRLYDAAGGEWGHITVDQIILTDQPRSGEGTWRLSEYRRSPDYYQERFRPGYHFTPELNWMNDPNGLTYLDGEYHLFYQHNPLGITWGHMSWGHAISRDLMHWQHLPIALHEEYDVMVYSGSCVVDERNTSGFGDGQVPPMVAIYTGHSNGRETQDIAYSNDRGRTWTEYAGNPVIDLGKSDFRDPKVFWHQPSSQWVMVVSLATEKRLQFYGSSDLKKWSLLSEFGPAGVEQKPNWECPDLFELPIENEPGQTRWVLEADMGDGAVAGGSGGEYFTGVFDGKRFVADSLQSKWVDFGRDFYAPVSWTHLPRKDGRHVWIGWMNNWSSALVPTYPWRSAMSTPRELVLRRIGDELRLCQRPVEQLEELRGPLTRLSRQSLQDESVSLQPQGQQLDLTLEFEPGSAKRFGVAVLKRGDEQTLVGYDTETESLFVDRTDSGPLPFHQEFPGLQVGPLSPDETGRVRMRILVDACSVEVFGNDGETVITDLVFPGIDSTQVELFAEGGTATLVSGEISPLRSVWTKPSAHREKP